MDAKWKATQSFGAILAIICECIDTYQLQNDNNYLTYHFLNLGAIRVMGFLDHLPQTHLGSTTPQLLYEALKGSTAHLTCVPSPQDRALYSSHCWTASHRVSLTVVVIIQLLWVWATVFPPPCEWAIHHDEPLTSSRVLGIRKLPEGPSAIFTTNNVYCYYYCTR